VSARSGSGSAHLRSGLVPPRPGSAPARFCSVGPIELASFIGSVFLNQLFLASFIGSVFLNQLFRKKKRTTVCCCRSPLRLILVASTPTGANSRVLKKRCYSCALVVMSSFSTSSSSIPVLRCLVLFNGTNYRDWLPRMCLHMCGLRL
jgi:hypothetical protein